jgi:hypothetical protein
LLRHFEPPAKQQERWIEELNTEIGNSPFIIQKTRVLSLFNFLLNHMDWVKIFVGISSLSEDLSLNFPQF